MDKEGEDRVKCKEKILLVRKEIDNPRFSQDARVEEITLVGNRGCRAERGRWVKRWRKLFSKRDNEGGPELCKG